MLQAKFLPTLKSLLVEPNTPLIHRDVSWLQFNNRVLAESSHSANPMLERAKFLSITASNIDEFFMIRISSLSRSIAALLRAQDKTRIRRLRKIRASILENVARFGVKQVEALDVLSEELHASGVHLVRHSAGDEAHHRIGEQVFLSQVLPRLGPPEVFSPAVITQLDNLQLGAIFKNNVWIRIPKSIPTTIVTRHEIDGAPCIFFLDELLLSHLGPTFRFDVPPALVRVTRDGDFTLDLEEEDTESVPDIIRTGVKTRDRGRPVRLQYRGDFHEGYLGQCMNALRLKQDAVIQAPATMCLSGLWSAVNQLPKEFRMNAALAYPPLRPVLPLPFKDRKTLFAQLKQHDLLLHHPYDAFDAYVEWIRAACEDPDVLKIEQTIYRMDTLSPVINLLKSAAARKKVRVIIELRARFDELNNLALADELRKAGVEVAFGFGKLKLHAKVALVTRKEEGTEKLYTHLSTGNYNASTARQYTDLAVISANPEIGADARLFFDKAWEGEVPTAFKHLLPAPARLHRTIAGLIGHEIEAARSGKHARIIAKVNALVDEGVIERLYEASNAGVQVDLIVRGACSLVPGVKGLSEKIRVVSVVDRFLEHSRIYCFENARSMFLSSADWMPRNFFSRLELAFPVLDPKIYSYLEQVVIPAYLGDTVKARELTPQGTWKKRVAYGRQPKVRSQFFLEQLAARAYEGTPLAEREFAHASAAGKSIAKKEAGDGKDSDPRSSCASG